MIILGVDPGTLTTGYGVIETNPSRSTEISVIEYGTVESKRIATLPKRLEAIFNRLHAVIERTNPDEFAIESAFYDKNIQSALKLGHARGVAILCAVLRQLPTAEYSPREIKRAVVGNGNAAKPQVEYMVRQMLKLPEKDLRLPDAYDALAVAITHSLRKGKSTSSGSVKNWEEFIKQNPGRVQKKS
jgi:crossover junction endodeoxyribonuclease RuvC